MGEKNNFFTRPFNIFVFAVIATLLWGSAIPVIKIGYESFAIAENDIAAKLLFAGIRFFFAGMVVVLVLSIVKKRLILPDKSNLKNIALIGFVQTTLQYIFFYISLAHLNGVKGSIINSASNFFALILAHIFLKNDKITFRKLIGCLVGFAGVVICNIKGGVGFDFGFNFLGEGFIIIAALASAMGSVIIKAVSKDTNVYMLTGYQLAFGGVILAATGFAFGGKLYFISLENYMIMLYLVLLSAIAFSLWNQLIKFNSVGKISVYGFLNPVFGVILSGILLNEDYMNIYTISALVLVSLGVLIVNKK